MQTSQNAILTLDMNFHPPPPSGGPLIGNGKSAKGTDKYTKFISTIYYVATESTVHSIVTLRGFFRRFKAARVARVTTHVFVYTVRNTVRRGSDTA